MWILDGKVLRIHEWVCWWNIFPPSFLVGSLLLLVLFNIPFYRHIIIAGVWNAMLVIWPKLFCMIKSLYYLNSSSIFHDIYIYILILIYIYINILHNTFQYRFQCFSVLLRCDCGDMWCLAPRLHTHFTTTEVHVMPGTARRWCHPSEKWWSSSIGMMFESQYLWENKKWCSKPPTSIFIYIYIFTYIHEWYTYIFLFTYVLAKECVWNLKIHNHLYVYHIFKI